MTLYLQCFEFRFGVAAKVGLDKIELMQFGVMGVDEGLVTLQVLRRSRAISLYRLVRALQLSGI